jgi:hypothetical protein
VPPRAQSPLSFSVPKTKETIAPQAPPPLAETIEENDDGADISDALSSPTTGVVKEKAHPEPVSNGIDQSAQEQLTLPKIDSDDMDVETLQKRLKLVEQRFTGMFSAVLYINNTDTSVLDVSTSFKRLQAEKLAADAVLRELSPLETMQDVESLRDFLQNVGLKTEVCDTNDHLGCYILTYNCGKISQDEIRRLTGKLQRAFSSVSRLNRI